MKPYTGFITVFAVCLLTIGCTTKSAAIKPVAGSTDRPELSSSKDAAAHSTQHRQLIRTVGFRGNRADPLGR